MNRQIVYPSALPRSFDFSQAQQNAGIALGWLAQAVMGSPAWAAGLACTPTSPASLVVDVGPGIIGQLTVVEENPFGTTLPADTTDPLVKMGVNISSTAMSALTPPVVSGQSQVWLLEGQMLEQDGTPIVLPYVNPVTPSQPFSGPNNGGAAQNTQRLQTVSLQWVAGASATTGTQSAPAVTAGWVPLYLVTLANGQTTITAANIAVAPAAPFFTTLPDVIAAAVAAAEANAATLYLPLTAAGRLLSIQVLTSTATLTKPTGATQGFIQMWGGGGGSGGTVGAPSAGLGGGGAEYAEGMFTAAQLNGQPATVGLGGTAGPGGVAGGPGSGSSVGALIDCAGGPGGSGANGAPATGSTAGGTGGTGGSFRAPGAGSSGTSALNTPSGTAVYTSWGGSSPRGGGIAHAGFSGVAQNGIAGDFPGGGAGGGCNAGPGAAGANGCIIVWWFS